MIVNKDKSVVFVVNYDEKNQQNTEELEQLQERYGTENVLFREFMVKDYSTTYMDKDGKEQTKHFQIPYFTEGKPNRHDRRSRTVMTRRPMYGEQKNNQESRTKHMRTRDEIKRDRARRK